MLSPRQTRKLPLLMVLSEPEQPWPGLLEPCNRSRSTLSCIEVWSKLLSPEKALKHLLGAQSILLRPDPSPSYIEKGRRCWEPFLRSQDTPGLKLKFVITLFSIFGKNPLFLVPPDLFMRLHFVPSCMVSQDKNSQSRAKQDVVCVLKYELLVAINGHLIRLRLVALLVSLSGSPLPSRQWSPC